MHALSNTEDDKCTLSFNDVIVRNILIEHESFRSDICILIICHIYIFQTPALNVLNKCIILCISDVCTEQHT